MKTASVAKKMEANRIVQEIQSGSSVDESFENSDDDWMPQNNRYIGEEDDEVGSDSQAADI